MTVGERIKKIRIFRKMTMDEFGAALGFEGKSMSVRIAQYETGARVPKADMLAKIAEVIDMVDTPNGIKDISTAIKNIKEIKGIKSSADMREQEARIRNLEKQAEKTDESNDITVTIGSEAEEYSG